MAQFTPGAVVGIAGADYSVRELRHGTRGHEVAFDGILDRTQAEGLRGEDVFVVRRRQLSSDEYWPSDLVGLMVTPGGGEVVDVVHGPSQDRLVVERGDSRFEVPFVAELVPVVDVDAGFVEIVELEGLSRP